MASLMDRTAEVIGDLIGRTIGNAFVLIFVKPIWLLVEAVLGLFKPSAIEQERRETQALYNQVKALYDASPLSGADPNDMMTEIVREALEQGDDTTPTLPVIEALCDLTEELIIIEGLWCLPEVEVWRELSAEEGVQLRNYLRGQKRFFSNFERNFDTWRKRLIWSIAGMLASFPESAFNESDETAHELRATLIDLMDEPATVVQRLMRTFLDDEIAEAGLYEELRERLNVNALRASGIDPEERYRTKKQIILPTNMRKKTPVELAELYLAGTAFERFFLQELPFTIPSSTRFEHCHIVGGTGHGKTQLMQLMIHRDLMQVRDGKASLVVIDSHGDLIRKLAHLAHFSPSAEQSLAEHFMLIDPNDIEFPVALNMFDMNMERLKTYSAVDREKILNGTIELYEYIFGALLGAELTQKQGVIFRYLARLMLAIPDATVQTLRELMEDGRPFKPYMQQLEGTSRMFFETQFFDRSFAATKQQILRRLWGVLSNTTFERMFSNPNNKVDMFDAMNSGKVILINTAKDLLKQEGCEIFGRFFIAMIAQAAMQRAAIAEDERMPTFVYIDEAQDYLDEHVEALFNQARKFKVALHIAHQNLDQLSRGLEASIMASTSIKLAGGVSAKDAAAFGREMQCEADFVRSMRKRRDRTEFACWIKNITPQPIKLAVPIGFLESLPSLSDDDYSALIAKNRERYCVARSETEQPPSKHEPSPPPPGAPSETAAAPTVRPSPAPAEAGQASVPEAYKLAREPRLTDAAQPSTPYPGDVPPPLGRGGSQHKYLQQIVKQTAEERGFRATIEQPTNEGGRVDVSLVKGDTKVAFEISVTTTPQQELANIEKCLAAGYNPVILLCPDQRRLNAIKRFVASNLRTEHETRVLFLLPDTFVEHLDALAAEAETSQQTVRGYRVKVTRRAISEADAKARRQAIAKIIARSLKGLEDKS